MHNSPHYEQIQAKLQVALERLKEIRSEAETMFTDMKSGPTNYFIDGSFIFNEEKVGMAIVDMENYLLTKLRDLESDLSDV